MDVPPTRVMRMLQMGEVERALGAASPWDCVSCQTCTARCPQGVDPAGVMDALRQLAVERGCVPSERRRVLAFQQAFLANIRRNGRLDEIELTALFKLRAFRHDRRLALLFRDAGLAPALRRRGKLHLRGERPAGRAVVARIFERCGAGGEAE
jgi:heterodisulfide reductase subunit C